VSRVRAACPGLASAQGRLLAVSAGAPFAPGVPVTPGLSASSGAPGARAGMRRWMMDGYPATARVYPQMMKDSPGMRADQPPAAMWRRHGHNGRLVSGFPGSLREANG
jgi:hypothetical protein